MIEEISSDFHSIWNKGKDNESLRFIDEKNAEKTISKIFWLESFRVVLKDISTLLISYRRLLNDMSLNL